ncbi:hypothetical protein OROGR_012311 [Orobanche gracilis]
MKFSKSILNPIRATRNGGGTVSLSFLRPRLRRTSNGSFKGGGQASSPFFTTTTEPSSPKVTCIGQVRVKSKKKAKHCRSLRAGEISFNRREQKNSSQRRRLKNQRWVHLPISICEALRAFGSEFSCLLFPCRFSCCFSKCEGAKNGDDKIKSGCCDGSCENDSGGCGAVNMATCLVFSRRREIEVVVGGGDAGEEEMVSSRRHVLDGIEVKNGRIEVKGQSLEVEEEDDDEKEEERGRVSICIPPENALLLMRCRSDPTKMAALANVCNWEYQNEDIEEEEEEEEEVHEQVGEGICEDEYNVVKEAEAFVQKDIMISVKHNEEDEEIQSETEQQVLEINEERLVENEQELKANDEEGEETQQKIDDCEEVLIQESPTIHLSSSPQSEKEATEHKNDVASIPKEEEEKEEEEEEESEGPLHVDSEEDKQKKANQKNTQEFNESNQLETKKEEEEEEEVLPKCLLLMMCEPKLSMEVSKETWVRRTDFIGCLPERPRKPAKVTGCDHHQAKRRPSVDAKSNPSVPAPPAKRNERHQIQPPRSSCSLPVAAMAIMIERKLGAYEPSALTRCNSEPMRTAATKLMPDSCLWKNGGIKVETHERAALGVGGAAGVGF